MVHAYSRAHVSAYSILTPRCGSYQGNDNAQILPEVLPDQGDSRIDAQSREEGGKDGTDDGGRGELVAP